MESTDYLRRYVQDENGCWNYTGTINKRGYGQIRQTTAHRFFWQHLRGPVPDGLHLDHLCYNRRCVNPEHLEPVTNLENQRRRRQHDVQVARARIAELISPDQWAEMMRPRVTEPAEPSDPDRWIRLFRIER